MKPVLNVGDLIIIKEINPAEIKVGDIIIFKVIPALQQQYHYPPIVAHRVIKIEEKNGEVIFRTKGDAISVEDPFSVRPVDLKGKIYLKVPYVGLGILFLQSPTGKITISIAFILLVINSYSKELTEAKAKLSRKFFAPVLEEQIQVKEALNQLAMATSEYAQHLASHTKAIQNLAKATEKLEKVVERLEATQKRTEKS